MPLRDSPKSAVETEREILQALCSTTVGSVDWQRAVRRLARHSWRNPEHEVVYGALRALKAADGQERREQLPAQATRMGFPDVDWPRYLIDEAGISEPVDRLIDVLEETA